RGSWTKFTNPDYAGIARAYGADGERITSAADLGPALQRGVAAAGPYVIDVPIDVNVHLVDNHVSGPAFLLDGRDIPADGSGVRGAGAPAVRS
ncbi:MAG: thiamine pyrophosphate-dependent enzyme, partial [Mycobacterium sp.]